MAIVAYVVSSVLKAWTWIDAKTEGWERVRGAIRRARDIAARYRREAVAVLWTALVGGFVFYLLVALWVGWQALALVGRIQ